MSENIANKDEALKCAAIAKRALADGDLAKAEKWAQKANKLFTSPQIAGLLLQIQELTNQGSKPEPKGPTHGNASGGNQPHRNGASTSNTNKQHPTQQNGHAHGAGQRSSSSHARPNGMGGSTVRQRTAQQAEQPAKPVVDPGTPEQIKLVQQVLKAKDFYDVLGLTREAVEDDIKKAYKKLALKLHPDKNKALKADEAFKVVSKAFSCLSDTSKRAYYDRTGHESPAAASAAASASASADRYQRSGGMYYEEVNPEEIFNMFFGGLNGRSGMFHTHFGPRQQRRRPAPEADEAATQRNAIFGLLQFLPVLLLVLFTMFSGTGRPVFSLVRESKYPEQMTTSRLAVPFYVRSIHEIEKSYPRGSTARYRLERQIESEHYEYLQQRCQQEKLTKHRLWSWGNREEARKMPMASCDEIDRINQKLGARPGTSGYF